MNLYKLELKRLLKTKSVKISIIFSIFITVIFSYLPIHYEKYTYIDDNKNEVEIRGLDAILKKKNDWKLYNGDVTPEKLIQVLNIYKQASEKYGEENFYPRSSKIPHSEYYQKIEPIKHLVNILTQVYHKKFNDITQEDIFNFYNYNTLNFNNLIKIQENHPNTIKQAEILYSHIKTPFIYNTMSDTIVLDYIVMLIIIFTFVYAIIAAPIFANEYQTESNYIIRCTKFGGAYLAKIKILSCLTIASLTYLFCTVGFTIFFNSVFGWDICKTSSQMIYNPIILANLNFGQVEFIIIIFGLISLIAIVCFILFLSNITKSIYGTTVIVIALYIISIIFLPIFPVLPSFLYTLFYIIPTGGIFADNNFLDNLLQTIKFIHIGSFSIWLPIALFIIRLLEIPIFIYLIIYSYCKVKK